MNTFILYIIKVAVYLAAFFLVYSLMLSRDTSYSRNRAFILLSLASAIILPLFSFQTIKPHNIQLFGKLLSEVFITASKNDAANPDSGLTATGPLQIIYTVYIIGAIGFLFRLVIDFMNLLFLITRQKIFSYPNEFTELLLWVLVFLSLVMIVFSIISYFKRFLTEFNRI